MNNFHQSPQAYVGHVTLNVMDLNRSIPFYTEMLGFNILNQTATSVDFTADGSTSLLTINQPAHVTPRPQRTTGMYHFALLLPQRSDLADLLAHFITTGLPYGASDHLVSEALYIADPDGNEIEIYTDRQADEWTWLEDGVQMTIDPINGHDLLTLRNPEGWQGLPAKTIMGHIHLYVSELQATADFYVKGLGFAIASRYSDQALFLSTGNYHHHIALNTWMGVGAPTPPENSTGLDFYTIVYPDATARETAIQNVIALGGSVVEKGENFLTIDPAGNHILLSLS